MRGENTTLGFLRMAADTSSSFSTNFDATLTRNVPRSARSTLAPISIASRSTAVSETMAFCTSPADSEVSLTMRSTTISRVMY